MGSLSSFVKYISNTQQLKDFADFARQTGRQRRNYSKMNYNQGFLVTDNPLFCNGIECNPWPLNRDLLEQTLTTEQLDLFDSKTDDLNIGNGIALLDMTLLEHYVHACEEHKQAYHVKYVEVYRSNSSNAIDNSFFESIAKSYRFLGYDIGECAYDYYSAVLSDIINRPSLFGLEIRNSLNNNGLFETFEEAKIFLAQRKSKIQFDVESLYERCDVDIIKLYGLAL